MEEVKFELNSICRVCLQTGDMERLFGLAGEDTALSLKFVQCSSIELIAGNSMPELICAECVHDLETAYRFRTNCESSDAILRSFVETAALNEIINNAAAAVVACDELNAAEAAAPQPQQQQPELDAGASLLKRRVVDLLAAGGESGAPAIQPPAALEAPMVGAQRLIADDAIIEGVEFDDVDRGMLKVKVLGDDQYVEYRVNVADVDLLSDAATFQLVQHSADADEEVEEEDAPEAPAAASPEDIANAVDTATIAATAANIKLEATQFSQPEMHLDHSFTLDDFITRNPDADADAEPQISAKSIEIPSNNAAEDTAMVDDLFEICDESEVGGAGGDVAVVDAADFDDDDDGEAYSPIVIRVQQEDELMGELFNVAIDGKELEELVEATAGDENEAAEEAEPIDPDTEILQIKPVTSNKSRLAKGRIGQSKRTASTPIAKPDATASTSSDHQPPTSSNGKEPKAPKVCEICGNQYRFQHALDGHMRRHRNEKPFECKICGKGFVINFELSRHMRTHTGQKPYQCQFCDKRFSDFGSRVKHERTHTGERPYPCEVCGKSFAYSHVLTSHMLTHTGVKRFGCDTCGKRFTKSHHLKAHMNTHDRLRSQQQQQQQIRDLMAACGSETNGIEAAIQPSIIRKPGSSRKVQQQLQQQQQHQQQQQMMAAVGDLMEEDDDDDGERRIEFILPHSDQQLQQQTDADAAMHIAYDMETEDANDADADDADLMMGIRAGQIITDEETGENYVLDMSELGEDDKATVHLIRFGAGDLGVVAATADEEDEDC